EKEGKITVRRASDGKVLRSLEAHKTWTRKLAASLDGHWLASISRAAEPILLWDARKERIARRLSVHGKAVRFTTIAFSADSATLAAGTEDGPIYLWNVADGKLIRTLAGHLGIVHDLTFHP